MRYDRPAPRRGSVIVTLLALGLLACTGRLEPPPSGFALGDPEAAMREASLRESVDRIVAARSNPGRLAAARDRARELGLEAQGHSEWIDWFSFQRNYVIEIPGRSEGLVYVVAHYDKTDANPLKLASLLLNGLIDEAVAWSYFSQGAHDNATGVAVALELAHVLATQPDGPLRHRTRILLTGAEESGLRGSRAHVARLSDDDWRAIRYVVNIDSVAVRDRANCLMSNASHPGLVKQARAAASRVGVPLGTGLVPAYGAGDHASFRRTSFWHDFVRGLGFNLAGGLLPQRSWFTKSRRSRVVTFAACDLVDWSDLVAGSLLLPVGRLHGARDRASRVDGVKLHEQLVLLRELLLTLDAED